MIHPVNTELCQKAAKQTGLCAFQMIKILKPGLINKELKIRQERLAKNLEHGTFLTTGSLF